MEPSRKLLHCKISPEDLKDSIIGQKTMKVLKNTLLSYQQYSEIIPYYMTKNYESIDSKYLSKLSFNYKDKVEKVREGIKTNQFFFYKLACVYGNQFDKAEINENELKYYVDTESPYLRGMFLSILVREWADEGKEERDISYGQVLQELKKYFNYEDEKIMEKNVKILVPGSSCSRLIYELAKVGFKVEGIEDSYLYILASDYLFNFSTKNELQIVPRIHSFCSSYTEESVLRKHLIPNVDIKNDLTNVKEGDMTLLQGDFISKYKDKRELFDAVITVFGTESTNNIIIFVETVYNLLKKGGVWINFGCLNGFGGENRVGYNLTWDELKQVIINYGFEFKREETQVAPFSKIEGKSAPYTCGIVFYSVVKI